MIENIDATVIAQNPKLLPYRRSMAQNIGEALKLTEGKVNVKATTEEGLGFTGAGDGISCQAICSLEVVQNYSYDAIKNSSTSAPSKCSSCSGGCCSKKK